MCEDNFRDIPGYENLYRINIKGEILSFRRGWRKRAIHLTTKGYLSIALISADGERAQHQIHRLIYTSFVGSIPPKYQLDHINGVKTDNRLENLRLATNTQNQWNVKREKVDTASKYIGVTYRKDRGHWRADICDGDTRRYLGSFDSDTKAAIAYDLEAIKLRGAFAVTNLIKAADKLEGYHEC